jgi:hypothetical protein
MEVQVRVKDPGATVTRDVTVEVREGAETGDLIEALVRLFEWPRKTISGESITYQLLRELSGSPLEIKSTVTSLGLRVGDELVLGPVLPRPR